jgi:hypothetical protein
LDNEADTVEFVFGANKTVTKMPQDRAPSLIGASVRSVKLESDYDSASYRSPSRSNQKVLKDETEEAKDYTSVSELHDEGALLNDEHEYDDLLDDTGKVKEGISASAVIITGVSNPAISTEKKEEIIRAAAGAPVAIDESDKDFVVVDIKKQNRPDLAAETSSTPSFAGAGPSIYELKNQSSNMSLEDLIDSQMASMSAMTSDLQKRIVEKKRKGVSESRSRSKSRLRSSLHENLIPNSVIENDAFQQVPAGAHEGMASPLIQSRSQSVIRNQNKSDSAVSERPHLARGDSYIGVTNDFEYRPGRRVDRPDPLKGMSAGSREFLRSVSRSRSRVTHEAPVSNKDLVGEGALINDELDHEPELVDRIDAVQEEDETQEANKPNHETSAFASLKRRSVPLEPEDSEVVTAAPVADVEDEEEVVQELEKENELGRDNLLENNKRLETGSIEKGGIETTAETENADPAAEETAESVTDEILTDENEASEELAKEKDQEKEEWAESDQAKTEATASHEINTKKENVCTEPEDTSKRINVEDSNAGPEVKDVYISDLKTETDDSSHTINVNEEAKDDDVDNDEKCPDQDIVEQTTKAISGLSVADETERLINEIESGIEFATTSKPVTDDAIIESESQMFAKKVLEESEVISEQTSGEAAEASGDEARAKETVVREMESKSSVPDDFDDLKEPTKDEIIEMLKDEPVYIFTSLAGGGYHMPQRTNKLATILTGNRIPFTYRDLGTDEEARSVWRRYSKGRMLPGIVRGKDDIIGNWEEIEEANEDYKVRELIYETL